MIIINCDYFPHGSRTQRLLKDLFYHKIIIYLNSYVAISEDLYVIYNVFISVLSFIIDIMINILTSNDFVKVFWGKLGSLVFHTLVVSVLQIHLFKHFTDINFLWKQ